MSSSVREKPPTESGLWLLLPRGDILSPMKWLLLILVVLFLILQYALWFGESSLPRSWALRDQVQQQEQKNAKLLQRNKTLEAEVLDLKQGKDAIEERARSELGMIRKGETFYHIIEEDKKEQ